jgi:ATP-dependent Clp endopeptidase proteolytic subunit ClpP
MGETTMFSDYKPPIWPPKQDGVAKKLVSLDDILRYNEIKSGKLHLIGEINTFSIAELIETANEAVHLGCKKLTLHITSPGGEVYPSFALYDHFKMLSGRGIKTTAIVAGYAASAAAMIALQAADIRTCYPSTRFLCHEVRTWGSGMLTTSGIKDEAREMDTLAKMITDVLMKRCGKTEKDVADLIERKEIWMSAEEALKWGLIDKILT